MSDRALITGKESSINISAGPTFDFVKRVARVQDGYDSGRIRNFSGLLLWRDVYRVWIVLVLEACELD